MRLPFIALYRLKECLDDSPFSAVAPKVRFGWYASNLYSADQQYIIVIIPLDVIIMPALVMLVIILILSPPSVRLYMIRLEPCWPLRVALRVRASLRDRKSVV